MEGRREGGREGGMEGGRNRGSERGREKGKERGEKGWRQRPGYGQPARRRRARQPQDCPLPAHQARRALHRVPLVGAPGVAGGLQSDPCRRAGRSPDCPSSARRAWRAVSNLTLVGKPGALRTDPRRRAVRAGTSGRRAGTSGRRARRTAPDLRVSHKLQKFLKKHCFFVFFSTLSGKTTDP